MGKKHRFTFRHFGVSVKFTFFILCLYIIHGCSVIREFRAINSTGEVSLPDFAPYDGVKRTIAVIDFENKSQVGDEKLGSAISDMIIAALVRSGRFTVVERSALDQILEEQALGQAGVLTEETAAKVANLLGVQALVFGSITDIRLEQGRKDIDPEKEDWSLSLQASVANILLDFRIVNSTTGEILLADNASAFKIRPGLGFRTQDWEISDLHKFDETLLGKASREAAHKAVSKIVSITQDINWFGKIIKVSATQDTVFFTPGEFAGIARGAQFYVYPRDHEENRDLSESVAIIEVIDFVGDKVSRAIKLRGYAIQVGDIVYEKKLTQDSIH